MFIEGWIILDLSHHFKIFYLVGLALTSAGVMVIVIGVPVSRTGSNARSEFLKALMGVSVMTIIGLVVYVENRTVDEALSKDYAIVSGEVLREYYSRINGRKVEYQFLAAGRNYIENEQDKDEQYRRSDQVYIRYSLDDPHHCRIEGIKSRSKVWQNILSLPDRYRQGVRDHSPTDIKKFEQSNDR
jgi:hypothetical protein